MSSAVKGGGGRAGRGGRGMGRPGSPGEAFRLYSQCSTAQSAPTYLSSPFPTIPRPNLSSSPSLPPAPLPLGASMDTSDSQEGPAFL